MTRRLVRLIVAASLLTLASGCAAVVSGMMDQVIRQHNADGPTFFVPQPAVLAKVHKIVVPDFRVRYASGQKDAITVYAGSPGEGKLWQAAPEFGSVVAEFLEEALLRLPGIDVLERNQLKHLLAEQHMQMSGLVDAPTLTSGQLDGADAILLGTLTQGQLYSPRDPLIPSLLVFGLHVRLLDLRTGRILMVYRDRQMASGTFPDLDRLLDRLANRFTERLQAARQPEPVPATP